MFMSKNQAKAAYLAEVNAQLLEFAKEKISACIEAAVKSGRNNVGVSFLYSDDAATIAAAFLTFSEAGYVVSEEQVLASAVRYRALNWSV